jgi:DNA-binding HxlR family transcriptional regulator
MALKVRRSSAPPPPPGCPIAACMAVLGGAWTPVLIWKLSGDARRFGELQRDIPAISPKMLTARLRDLEEKGVVVVINTIVRVGTRIREGASRRASAA